MSSVHHSHKRYWLAGLHLEPFWWGLFSAGGGCVAVFVLAVTFIFGILWPLGIVDIDQAQLASWYQSLWGLIFTGAVMVDGAARLSRRPPNSPWPLRS